jgi:hypothetical protein
MGGKYFKDSERIDGQERAAVEVGKELASEFRSRMKRIMKPRDAEV